MPEQITSNQNPRIKLIRSLRDKRDRLREQRFVLDSARDLSRALDCGIALDFVLADSTRLSDPALAAIPSAQIFEVPSDLLERVSYRDNADGLVAVMHTPDSHNLTPEAAVADAPVLGLVGLSKPGNIGALLRTADAAGFQTVLLIDCPTDLYNPNVIRSSTGAVFLKGLYSTDAAQARAFFRAHQLRVVGTHLSAAVDAYSQHYDDKTVLLLGAEDVGLDESWLTHCDIQVLIPMAGRLADSLNVSVAGAVLMYEVLRQRRTETDTTQGFNT